MLQITYSAGFIKTLAIFLAAIIKAYINVPSASPLPSGRIKVTMLTPTQEKGRSYNYAAWLDQIECTMACGLQQQGGWDKLYYIPVNKSSRCG
jgi:hypothetical protein